MFSITEATLEFESHFRKIYTLYGGDDKVVQSFLTHKLRHVYGVLDATLRVIATEPSLHSLDRAIKRKAEIVALLHDIGRFYQVGPNGIVGNAIYEHGDGAFAILQAKYPDRQTINLAVKIHNKFSHTHLFKEDVYTSLSQSDQEEALLLTKIIRDADKLQNLTYDTFDNFVVLEKFDKQVHSGDEGFANPTISQAVLDSIKNKSIILHKDVQTFADSLLVHYTWLLDINFSSTMKQLKHIGFVDALIHKLKTIGVPDQQINQIPRLDIV